MQQNKWQDPAAAHQSYQINMRKLLQFKCDKYAADHTCHEEKQNPPLFTQEHWLGLSVTSVFTHHGVTPELSHLSDPHGHQQGLPDLHLEHLSDKDLSWSACHSAVINDRSFKIIQQRLEMENQLGWKEGRTEINKCNIMTLLIYRFNTIANEWNIYLTLDFHFEGDINKFYIYGFIMQIVKICHLSFAI